MVVTKDSTSSRALPKSGSEREFTYDPWGTTGLNHDNCYDYAFGSFSASRPVKSAPGDRKNIPSTNMNYRSCDGIVKRVLADNPGSVYKMRNPNGKPRPGFYKVMCFVALVRRLSLVRADGLYPLQGQGWRYRLSSGQVFSRSPERDCCGGCQAPQASVQYGWKDFGK